ncbi:MAG: restriction endonuclease subunit S [Campylobacter sp.]|uniref:restriction endonuclease subunit S n=1 Tax=Campylobacter sp. TaxID=205 RepID=UPI002A7EF9E5|nr:restriction endonuclease subunit S [Campylobacter sp.]MCI7587585.1 restriction endonuclease subunit S [Campylobacter sp.]MDY5115502.1 restriction endonuclease subunit S [Campylobacter sp.]
MFEQYRGKEKAPNQCKDGNIPLINEISTNNGLSKYATPTKVFTRNAITISINYATTVFYQSMDFCASVNISILKNDKILNKKRALFIISQLRKINQKYDYTQKISKDKINDTKIQLPITASGEIDFDFMESFIAELEAERVRELEAYLKASGLSDTTLNPDEKSALNTWNSRIWQEFRIGDFFDIRNTTGLNTDKLNDGLEYDYITRTSNNQGILKTTGLVNQSNLNEAGVWSLGLLQMDFFYRKRQWYAGQFVRKIIPKIKLSKNAILFFTTLLNCQKKILLSVLVRNVDETFRNLKIQLPITANGEIDFEFMESFIKAIQKECIKGVDSYLSKNIATTKEVINN